MLHVVVRGDTASKIAQQYTGNQKLWPELCAANPQLPRHPTYGCEFHVGNTLELPASWGVEGPPVPGAPVGPIPTGPNGEPAPLAPPVAEARTKINATTIMIGAAVVAGLVVVVYAIKKKGQGQTPNRRRRKRSRAA